MYKVKEAIIVEGMYDKARLSQFIDGVILTTHGFAVFTSPDFAKTIERLARESGIVILTDSDSAGMKIRNFIKQKVPEDCVKHAYIPDIAGKERRKRKPSAEGLLGVEGMSESVIIKALRDAGCTINDTENRHSGHGITKTDLYLLGLSGGAGSRALREALAHRLELPAKLSANMLLDVLNHLVAKEQLYAIVEEIKAILSADKS